MHTHKAKTIHGPFPFMGSVSRKENKSAHGNIMQLHTCSCGHSKLVNVNGNHIENSDWIDNDATIRLYKSVRMIQALEGSA
jgi:hypothetical protein